MIEKDIVEIAAKDRRDNIGTAGKKQAKKERIADKAKNEENIGKETVVNG
jgi:hypothetical protein